VKLFLNSFGGQKGISLFSQVFINAAILPVLFEKQHGCFSLGFTLNPSEKLRYATVAFSNGDSRVFV